MVVAQQKTVAVFTDSILPFSQTFVIEQAKLLPNWKAFLAGLQRDPNGISSITIPNYELINSGVVPAKLAVLLFKLTRSKLAFFDENKFCDADLIHSHFGPNGSTILPTAKKLAIPLVTTYHGYESTIASNKITWRDPSHKLFVYREKELLENGNLFIAVSDFLKNRMLEQGVPENKTVRHYIGVNVSHYASFKNLSVRRKNRVVFIGRLIKTKGIQYLLNAMETVQSKVKDVELVIIGDGPMRSSVEDFAKNKLKNVQILGSLNHEKTLEELNKGSILCVPSCIGDNGQEESFGMVFAEAMSLGIPVVSSSIGGIPEVVKNGVTGLLAKERDSAELAECLLGLLSDSNAREKMGMAGKERVSNLFDIRKQSKSLESIYTSLT